jgi:hypothetical protein
MAYPDLRNDPDFLENLLTRKEFYSLKMPTDADGRPVYNFRDPPDVVNMGPLESRYLKLHSHQLFVDNFMSPNTEYRSLHLMHGTGCHAPGTQVLRADGTPVSVERVRLGERILGDDGTLREVQVLYSGVDDMYEVRLLRSGDTFRCNNDHVLTIKFGCDTYDIPLCTFMALPPYVRAYARMFRAVLRLPQRETATAPRAAGAAADVGARIPDEYRLNSPCNVVDFVSGLVSTRGYEFECSAEFARGLQFMCRSVGVSADIVYAAGAAAAEPPRAAAGGIVDNAHTGDNGDTEDADVDSDADTADADLDTRTDADDEVADDEVADADVADGADAADGGAGRVTVRVGVHFDEEPFAIEYLGAGEYCGFSISGNGRYALSNLIVTHNSGKTLAAVSVANQFINVYKRIYASAQVKIGVGRRHHVQLDMATPSVFVLGFGGPKDAFVRELLNYPEFGFVSVAEHDEFLRLRKLAAAGLPEDVRALREYTHSLRRRIQNKDKGGFYKFFGYDEFVNRLFVTQTNLTQLEKEVNSRRKSGEQVTLESEIKRHIRDGTISVNTQLLAMFENSLLICDEIHNTYNKGMRNNRGVAIGYVLETVPSMRFLSMSATPINNSPTEVVELINYLNAPHTRVEKRELFASDRKLLPGALERIGDLTFGKVSFLQKIDFKYYPRRVFVGDFLRLPEPILGYDAGATVPYLRFVECRMSEMHQATWMNMVETHRSRADITGEIAGTAADTAQIAISPAESGATTPVSTAASDALGASVRAPKPNSPFTVAADGYSIYDCVFPNPESDRIGLYRSGDTRNRLQSAPQEWRDRVGVSVRKIGGTLMIGGAWLNRKNIGKYSTKMQQLLATLGDILASAGGDPSSVQKCIVYHNRVKMSGVLLVQEALVENGFIDETSEATDSTICVYCGRTKAEHEQPTATKVADVDETIGGASDMRESDGGAGIGAGVGTNTHRANAHRANARSVGSNAHSANAADAERASADTRCRGGASGIRNHTFSPARFAMIHIEIDAVRIDNTITLFNSPENIHGEKIFVLVGSKKIKESIDFKDVQNMILLSMPPDIPTLLQVIGRCVRTNSHLRLPLEQRRVFLHVLISTVNPQYPASTQISPELYRCVDKLDVYKVIQIIEREINRRAIDADIHRDIIMSPEQLAEYFPHGRPQASAEPTQDSYGDHAQAQLGNLYFEPAYRLPALRLDSVNLSTFGAYGFNQAEIRTIVHIIKRLFFRRPVYTYEDLWAAVQRPPVELETNPAMFSEGNFIIALSYMTTTPTQIVSSERIVNRESFIIERLFDYNERYIYMGSRRCAIRHVSKYYILFPLADDSRGVITNMSGDNVNELLAVKIPIPRVIMDVETYLRPSSTAPGMRISVAEFVKRSKVDTNYEITKAQLLTKYANADDTAMFNMLTDYSGRFQSALLEDIVSYMVKANVGNGSSAHTDVAGEARNSDGSASADSASDDSVSDGSASADSAARPQQVSRQSTAQSPAQSPSVDAATRDIYAKIIRLYDKFRCIIYMPDIVKYRDTMKHFTGGPPAVADSVPIGYMSAKSVRLYDPVGAEWFEVSKASLNRHVTFKENDIIVGYFEDAVDHMKFKLRKPVQLIREDIRKDIVARQHKTESEYILSTKSRSRAVTGDTRLVERGIVCSTKTKHTLLRILASLGVSVSKLSRTQMRIRPLCWLIKMKLLENEIKERQRDSKHKWLYSWFDQQPSLV